MANQPVERGRRGSLTQISPCCAKRDDTAKLRQSTAVIEREGDGYVATCPKLDVVSQGRTIEEARLNLVEAGEGFFEVASPSEVRRRLKKETYVMPIVPTMSSKRTKHVARLQRA